MKVNQIYNVINDMMGNMTTANTPKVVDTRTFMTWANTVLSDDDLYNKIYSNMVGQIYKVFIAIRVYKSEDTDILVDSFEFGCVMQKVSAKIQEAENNSAWAESTETSLESPYDQVPKGGIVAEYFIENLATFCFKDVYEKRQTKDMFRNEVDFGAFWNLLYTRMVNAMEMAKEELNINAKNALFASVYRDTTNANYTRRVVKANQVFNALHTGETDFVPVTTANYLSRKDFLFWLNTEWKKTRLRLARRNTSLYNNGQVERFTPDDALRFDVNIELSSAYEQIFADTFNPEYMNIPRHKEVVDYGISTDPTRINVIVDDGTTSGQTVNISVMVAAMYDKDAVVGTFEFNRFVNFYDQWNDRYPIKTEADRRYIVSMTENCIIYVIEDGE